ncbi:MULTISPECIES: DUF1285 domain-containing protein [unclassified Psychrobacter]|uniref:DUF1285 domain-containing protein n=1 Tax=unclassified Psychrobacter TaxID=196806 RepID=UPI003FA34EE5
MNKTQGSQDLTSSLDNADTLSQYIKSAAGVKQGRAIPPLEDWHPEQVVDMDLVIKANGEWWHEGGHMTRESLVNLFATVLWKEEQDGVIEYFLKTPVQKLRIQVEDVPLLINDVGIITEGDMRWLEFTTTTGDVVRLDEKHPITLATYQPKDSRLQDNKHEETPVRPYMPIRNGLTALIGRNTFYHLTEIGELTQQEDETILTLQSGGQSYLLSMPAS